MKKINSLRIELLAKYESNTNNRNNDSERLITHLLDQFSFLKDQLKSKDQMLGILVSEQMHKGDEATTSLQRTATSWKKINNPHRLHSEKRTVTSSNFQQSNRTTN